MNATQRLSALIGIVLLLLLPACQSTPQPSWKLPEGVKTIGVNGYPMAYLERGAGETVVLVPGSLTDYRHWDPQMESLSSRFRLIAVSPRHFYPEIWNGQGGNFSIKVHAEDLAAFLERLGVGPVHLVGWSRGGSIALGTAKIRPDLVKKLVLMEPAVYSLSPGAGETDKPDLRQARAQAAVKYFEKGQIDTGLEIYVDDIIGPGGWKRLTDTRRQELRDNAWTAIGQMNDVDTVNCADLRKIRIPTLLVGGEKGPGYLAVILDAAQKCLPAVRRVTISNAGHSMNRQNPKEFDRALVQFLSE